MHCVYPHGRDKSRLYNALTVIASVLCLIILTLLLVFPITVRAQEDEPPLPRPHKVHIVRAGESVQHIIRRYRIPLGLLRRHSPLAAEETLPTGVRMRVPGPLLRGTPIAAVHIAPNPARQGQTVRVHIAAHRPVTLSLRFGGITFPVSVEGNAFVGIHPLLPAGIHPLTVRLEQTDATTELVYPLQVVAGDFETVNIQLSPQTSTLLAPDLTRAERERLRVVWEIQTPVSLWEEEPFAHPLQGELRVTGRFGQRRSYNNGPVSDFHTGVDYGAPEGTPVYAPAAGVVVLAETLVVRGNAVILDHGLGILTGYWHLASILVQPGQSVAAGELIGTVGSTGLSTGAHLHWEMRIRGVPVAAEEWTQGGEE